MQHFQIVHEDEMYECKQCNVKISGMEQMRKHISANHRYSKRTWYTIQVYTNLYAGLLYSFL